MKKKDFQQFTPNHGSKSNDVILASSQLSMEIANALNMQFIDVGNEGDHEGNRLNFEASHPIESIELVLNHGVSPGRVHHDIYLKYEDLN